ncbi:hypothetical protein V1478_007332 [Vespula squamosa]|uniref:Uncharacterized protein n=1 Tax=Vespula squamosa TaxID=30214 RepID=A0ABD2B2U2_VESSQ
MKVTELQGQSSCLRNVLHSLALIDAKCGYSSMDPPLKHFTEGSSYDKKVLFPGMYLYLRVCEIVKVQWDLFIIGNFRFSFFYLHFIVVRTSLIGRNIDSERRHAFRIVTDIAMAENVDGKPMETNSGIIDR